MVTEVVKDEEGHIKGVITESKSGRQAVLAKRVIDCTGDADVAHLAGCPYTLVPKADRMGATTVFNASGVDKAKFLNYANNEGAKTYADWSKGTEWKQETTGKEEELSSPFLEEEFQRAQTMGVIPAGAAQGPPPHPTLLRHSPNPSQCLLERFTCVERPNTTLASPNACNAKVGTAGVLTRCEFGLQASVAPGVRSRMLARQPTSTLFTCQATV